MKESHILATMCLGAALLVVILRVADHEKNADRCAASLLAVTSTGDSLRVYLSSRYCR